MWIGLEEEEEEVEAAELNEIEVKVGADIEVHIAPTEFDDPHKALASTSFVVVCATWQMPYMRASVLWSNSVLAAGSAVGFVMHWCSDVCINAVSSESSMSTFN